MSVFFRTLLHVRLDISHDVVFSLQVIFGVFRIGPHVTVRHSASHVDSCDARPSTYTLSMPI